MSTLIDRFKELGKANKELNDFQKEFQENNFQNLDDLIDKFPTLSNEVKNAAKEVKIGEKTAEEFDEICTKATSSTSKFALALKNIAANVGITLGLTAGIKIISALLESEEKMRNNASNATASYKESLNDYKTEIQSLQDVLNDSSSSYQETCDARERLMDIQSELISNYGSEADDIDLVNQSLEEQSGIFDEIDKKARQTWENQVNEASDASTIFNGLIKTARSTFDITQLFNLNDDVQFFNDLFKNDLGLGESLKNYFNSDDFYTDVFGNNLQKIKDDYQDFSVDFKISGNDEIDSFIENLEGIEKDGKSSQ